MPVLPRDLVSLNVAAAAWSAARVLTAVGPLDTETLLEAVDRSRRFRHRTPFTATELSTALTAAGAEEGSDGRWHAPSGVRVSDRYRVIVERAADRDLTRAGMIEILICAGLRGVPTDDARLSFSSGDKNRHTQGISCQAERCRVW